MVSPQVLLGLGLSLPLLAIGGYLAWLSRRVDELERTAEGENAYQEETDRGE